MRNVIEIDGTKMQNLHFVWSNKIKPIVRAKSGDLVSVVIPDSSTMQVREDWTQSDLKKLDKSFLDGAVGPIFIEGASNGDTLEIEILDIKTGSWGYSTTEREAGLIRGRFEDKLIFWKVKDGIAETTSEFLKGIRLRIEPFLGVMGVAPESGEYPMVPPQAFGGNIDNKLLTAGSKLYLPVQTEGALLSVADPHAIQGDGEAGSTGLEISANVLLRLNLIKGKRIRFPRAIAKNGELLVTMGISSDLYEASKFAMEEMVSELEDRGFTAAEAYMLCSLVADLKISELVDEPNHVVSMSVPVHVLVGRK